MFSSLVSLFVLSAALRTKATRPIFAKIGGTVGNYPRKKPVDSGGNSYHDTIRQGSGLAGDKSYHASLGVF